MVAEGIQEGIAQEPEVDLSVLEVVQGPVFLTEDNEDSSPMDLSVRVPERTKG